MKTYEMVALAKENRKTYQTGDMYYNVMQGFHDSEGEPWEAEAYSYDANGLNDFIEEDKWEEVEVECVVNQSELENILLDWLLYHEVGAFTNSEIAKEMSKHAIYRLERLNNED